MKKYKTYLLYFILRLPSISIGQATQDRPSDELQNTSVVESQHLPNFQGLVEEVSNPAAQDMVTQPAASKYNLQGIKSKHIAINIFSYLGSNYFNALRVLNKNMNNLVQDNKNLVDKVVKEEEEYIKSIKKKLKINLINLKKNIGQMLLSR